MSDLLGRYRVRDGAALAHNGTVYGQGAVLMLPRSLAAEFPHKVDEIDAEGNRIQDAVPIEHLIRGTRTHEQRSILERERELTKTRLATIELLLAELKDEAAPVAAREPIKAVEMEPPARVKHRH